MSIVVREPAAVWDFKIYFDTHKSAIMGDVYYWKKMQTSDHCGTYGVLFLAKKKAKPAG